MKSRFIVLMLLVFAAALFTGCATTGDLEKLQAQVKQTDMKADQAAAKADMAAKDAAAAKATAAASQADCAKASEACNAAAAKAEQAAARADASGQAGRGQRQEDRSDVHEIHEKVEIRPRAETPEIGNEKAASDLSVTAFLLDSSPGHAAGPSCLATVYIPRQSLAVMRYFEPSTRISKRRALRISSMAVMSVSSRADISTSLLIRTWFPRRSPLRMNQR